MICLIDIGVCVLDVGFGIWVLLVSGWYYWFFFGSVCMQEDLLFFFSLNRLIVVSRLLSLLQLQLCGLNEVWLLIWLLIGLRCDQLFLFLVVDIVWCSIFISCVLLCIFVLFLCGCELLLVIGLFEVCLLDVCLVFGMLVWVWFSVFRQVNFEYVLMNGLGVFFLLKLYIFMLFVSRCIIIGVKFVLLEMMVKLLRLCVYSRFMVLIIIVMFEVFLFLLQVNCWIGWIVYLCSIVFYFFSCGFFQLLQVWCMLVMLQWVIFVRILLIFEVGVLLVLINRVMCFFGLFMGFLWVVV